MENCDDIISSHLLSVSVTVVKFIGNYLFAGVGGTLHVFSYLNEPIFCLRKVIFLNQNIYGICPLVDSLRLVLFGGKMIAVGSYHLDESDNFSLCIDHSWSTEQWIWHALWLTNSMLAIATAYNVVSLWDPRTHQKLITIKCVEKWVAQHSHDFLIDCLTPLVSSTEVCACDNRCTNLRVSDYEKQCKRIGIYSALIVGYTWESLVVLSGTVFQEVVVWSPNTESVNDSCVLHRLKGHQGVIFSVNYDRDSRRICSTSDDRTVRIWRVNFTDQKVGADRSEFVVDMWRNATITLHLTMFGHTARVWRSYLLSDERTLSIGEDSLLVLWDRDGGRITQWECHKGGGVWSLDVTPCCDLVVTGGGNGGIGLWPLSPSPEPHPLLTPSAPHQLALLCSAMPLIATQRGELWLAGCPGPPLFSDPHFASYCLLALSHCRTRLALAGITGHIVVLQESNEKLIPLIDTEAVNGKIFSLHWLSQDMLLTCGSGGHLQIWRIQFSIESGCGTLSNMLQLELPRSKEQWSTAVAMLLDGAFLICGDRAGSLHLYDVGQPQSSQMPLVTLWHVHGRFGVSCVRSGGGEGHVWTTGRDGMLRRFSVERGRLVALSIDKLPMEWAARVLLDRTLGMLVLGFSEKSFMVWSMREQQALLRVGCGGGHRSWDFHIDEDRRQMTFAFTKAKQVFVVSEAIESLYRPPLLTGLHASEINAACLMRDGTKTLVVTGGEDTTLRVSHIGPSVGDGHHWGYAVAGVMRSHVSSVRALAVLLQPSGYLVFSAGGRAQLKVWNVSYGEEEVICVEVASLMLHGEDRVRRAWRNVKPVQDPETRFMDLATATHGDSAALVLAAGSDGLLRLFRFDCATSQLSLISAYGELGHCQLKVALVGLNGGLLAASMGTDGRLSLWRVNTERGGAAMTAYSDTFRLHQSGINSCASWTVGGTELVLATGGDDSALAVTHFRVGLEAVLLARWTSSSVHTCQVTGLQITDKYILSAALDQRITLLGWALKQSKLHVAVLKQFCSSVPDLHGLLAWHSSVTLDRLTVYLFGAGFEVLEIALDKTKQPSEQEKRFLVN